MPSRRNDDPGRKDVDTRPCRALTVVPPSTGQAHSTKAIGPAPADAAFEAQVMGQEGRKRGLKAGPPAIEAAQNAYLGTEWSGRHDRRTRSGRLTRTEV